MPMDPWLLLAIGLVLAGLGGECFVQGVVGVARWLRVPAGIIGATIAAFATSSPEMSVAVYAAATGRPEIGLGDTLGSNVVNVALILGIALLFGSIKAERSSVRRDLPIALFGPVLTFVLLLDGSLSRIDAGVLMVVFILWLVAHIREAARARNNSEDVFPVKNHTRAIMISAFGLVCLVLAGRFIVTGAKDIGQMLGMEPFIIAATIVAVGTSTPELATVLASRLRKHDDIGLGTVLGSNIFNGLCISAVTAFVHPIEVSFRTTAIVLAFGLAGVLLTVPLRGNVISRFAGLLLLALYAVYVVVMLQQGSPQAVP